MQVSGCWQQTLGYVHPQLYSFVIAFFKRVVHLCVQLHFVFPICLYMH